jgi:glycosyltransferase involved in cell wall biosynthesis
LIQLGAPPEHVFEAVQPHHVRRLQEQLARERERLQIPPYRTFLFVGVLNERKSAKNLLKAFLQIASKDPDIRLRFVGDGPLRANVEAAAQQSGIGDRIEFAGLFEPDWIVSEYIRATAFVFPSWEDTFGVSVIEALACGVPVICSRFAGVSIYLKNEENSFFINPSDTNFLAERIGALLADESLRAQFIEERIRNRSSI